MIIEVGDILVSKGLRDWPGPDTIVVVEIFPHLGFPSLMFYGDNKEKDWAGVSTIVANYKKIDV
jgi:hypothetical protein